MKKLKAIAKKWNKLKSDEKRWEYLLAHKDEISLSLDNDETYSGFCKKLMPADSDKWDDMPELNGFNKWLGNCEGIYDFMNVIGIECDGV